MKLDLQRMWSLFGLPEPVTEFRFVQDRKWRFDYAWPADMVACEIEGGVFIGGRHTRGVGYKKDMEKYNRATLEGWRVFRFTPSQMRNGEAAELLERALMRHE